MESSNWDVDESNRNAIVQWISDKVGLDDAIAETKREICPERFFSKMEIVSLLGMAGIGKTTFARKLFSKFSNVSNFDQCVWVNLGPNYKAKEILIDILAQIYPNLDKLENEELMRELCVDLSNKRCLLVLDDLWSQEPLLHLKNVFPDIMGKTLVTTRLAKVAKFGRDDSEFEIPLLDKEESWHLFCKKVFGGVEFCPPKLEKPGRKIAEKCDGLPLLILTVSDQVLQLHRSEKCWNEVASGKEKSVFKKAHEQISESLLPSYQRLPQHLKPFFLYVGVFQERYEIPITRLTNLCMAERFLELEDSVAECLSELVGESLVMEKHKVTDLETKTCRLHSVFWHLANSQAEKNKFFHAMTIYDDCLIESIERQQRRLCIRNSGLLGLRDVQEFMESNTRTHSLLCIGPFQQYPVLVNFDMKLLRVMDVLTVRLYEFPVEVVRLIHLRYLALTCNGKLPTSISNLWKLEYLIMKRYWSIKSSKDSSRLPMEIWDLKELMHLQVMGGRLPIPKRGVALLKLSALLEVSAQSCRKKVFKGIPNLKRLGIRIELAPNDDGKSFHYLNCICHLHKLESLKCVVVNPQIRPEAVPPPAPLLMFPPKLKRLSLSGLGYPWEYMSTIGELKNLQVLKLKHYAFQGPTWEIEVGEFKKLKFLLVEDSNLVHWKANTSIQMNLERLCIKHCYKLQELPFFLPFGYYTKLEIVDCNTLTVAQLEQMARTSIVSKPAVHRSWIADTQRK